ncbi:MAG: Rieske (2Fe-2S) protein [Planctomycetales bacterium]|nr:Rieske (2Fe-2S) protein [Planctomycetales bacterium]
MARVRPASPIGAPVTWHYLCHQTEIDENEPREFAVDGRVVALFFDGQQHYAIDGMCAHQGGPLALGTRNGLCVTCPWHGWQYDISNGHNLLTGKQMLDCFPLEIREGQLWVELPESPQT